MAEEGDRQIAANPCLPWENVPAFTNRVAYDIHQYITSNKLSWQNPASAISAHYQPVNASGLSAACARVKTKRAKVIKNKSSELDSFLQLPFQLPLPTPSPKRKRTADAARDPDFQCVGCVDLPRVLSENKELKTELDKVTERSEERSDRAHDRITKLQEENKSLRKENQELKRVRASQEYRRLEDRVTLWKGKYLDLKDKRDKALRAERASASTSTRAPVTTEETERTVAKLKSVITSQRHYYKTKVEEAEQREIDSLRHETCLERETQLKARISELEWQLSQVQVDRENQQSETIKTKDGKSYSATMRLCIYNALQNQCPVDHAAEVVKFTVEAFTGQRLTQIPSSATVSQMAIELGTLGDLQAGQLLTETPNCMIAWDATDVGGAHINEVHVAGCTDEGRHYHTLSVAQLPGGKTGDYVQHIEESLRDTAVSYAQYCNTDTEDVHAQIRENITCTLSDRVAVNHCVTEALKATLNPVLLELHCNVHPLDSLASKSRAALKESGVRGQVFGKDCALANLIQTLSKTRYKQGTGDPGSFKIFFKQRGIPLAMFPRYVGNRLHILFHLAGVYYFLRADVWLFLEKFSLERGGMTKSMGQDIQNVDIVRHLRILGLLGKIVTGPWMVLFYSELGENLSSTVELNQCISFLEKLRTEPSNLATTALDCFGKNLTRTDPVLTALQDGGTTDRAFDEMVQTLAGVFLTVLRRQLADYLEEPSTEQRKLAKAAPTHNMQSERVMAMTDAQVRRAPNARMDFIESKVKSKTNHTLEWLKSQSEEELQNTISFAVKRSRTLAALKKERRENLQKELVKRLHDRSQRKDATARKKVEKEVAELEAKQQVSEEQVSELSKSLSTTEQSFLRDMFNKPAEVVGRKFLHTWFDSETQSDTVYHGRIVKLKKRKKCTFVVAYYGLDEGEEEATDYDMCRGQLVCDVLCADLQLE